MKKAKVIGLFMAAILAGAPATGLAQNVLPISDNAIVAEAAGSIIMVEPGNCRMKLFDFKLDGSAIMKNGNWVLKGEKNGDLYIYNTVTKKKKYLFKSPYNANSKYPKTNEVMKSFTLYFQGDGNIVAYANGKTNRPVYHSATYSTFTAEAGDCSYYYFLEDDGRLVIKRIHSKGADVIFDSSRCGFVRLV